MSSNRTRTQPCSRLEFLRDHPRSRSWAALDKATNDTTNVAFKPCMPLKNSLNGKKIVVIGSGVGGLTAAYELLARNDGIQVTILEARDRAGGRCMTLRTGDALTEDKTSDLNSSSGETQIVRFDRPLGDKEPYLNAGPGRIPSSHKHLLGYLRRFGVEVEVYVMNSESNMSQMLEGPFGDDPVVNRRLDHNTRGWIAQMVYKNADMLLQARPTSYEGDQLEDRVKQLQSLMVTFGDLDEKGNYVVGTAPPGQDEDENASDRAGFVQLPDVCPGEISDAIKLDTLLASEFWKKTRVYQPIDFLWQPSLFQPVGGMDRVPNAFREQIAVLGGILHLNSPVTNIEYREKKFFITAHGHESPFIADYCICNLAMPFLEVILSQELQSLTSERGFNTGFKEALHAVYATQGQNDPVDRFLAPTTKVGWQANRDLWEGTEIDADSEVPDSQVGVVPLYGGISWTDHPITQIWYPSTAYHDKRGVLTGCYNFAEDAVAAGLQSYQDRLDEAREGARGFGDEFADGLKYGVAIAWQNMAYIKGGWSQWFNVGMTIVDGKKSYKEEESVKHFNAIAQGTGVGGQTEPCFFIVGDQVSSLPGWQEGAIYSALWAVTRIGDPKVQVPYVKKLPDTRLMVEGV